MSHAPTHRLVIATSNRGKLEEIRTMLGGIAGLHVHAIDEVLKERPVIVEDGATFEENALKKARAIAAATTMMTLADDSGLEVDALEGRPGVRSARFAHERATDSENNAALLAAIDALRDPAQGSPERNHHARFRCVLALVDPYFSEGEPAVVEGRVEGTITRTPRGSGGFGYDPLFVVAGTDRTMAELSDEEKNTTSHRARAIAALAPHLRRRLDARTEAIARITRTSPPSSRK